MNVHTVLCGSLFVLVGLLNGFVPYATPSVSPGPSWNGGADVDGGGDSYGAQQNCHKTEASNRDYTRRDPVHNSRAVVIFGISTEHETEHRTYADKELQETLPGGLLSVVPTAAFGVALGAPTAIAVNILDCFVASETIIAIVRCIFAWTIHVT